MRSVAPRSLCAICSIRVPTVMPVTSQSHDTASKALISASLELVENLGEYALVHMVTAGGRELIVKMDKPPKAGAGETIHLTANAGSIHCFDDESGLKR